MVNIDLGGQQQIEESSSNFLAPRVDFEPTTIFFHSNFRDKNYFLPRNQGSVKI